MSVRQNVPALERILDTPAAADRVRLEGEGPAGRLPLTTELLRRAPSGDLFGLTQNAGMGWDPQALGRPEYLIVSTQGGLRDEDGRPVALGHHTGHWEIGLLVRRAAERTGLSQTSVVEEAISQLLQRLDAEQEERRRRVDDILDDIRGLLTDEDRAALSTDFLYDDDGLPA